MRAIPTVLLLASATTMPALETTIAWHLPAGATPPATAAICPLQYGKSWAYAVEIDDGPASTLSVVAPLLARHQFTDAPPGVTGGTARPFVGTAAVMAVNLGAGNAANLSWEQIAELRRQGWDIANHSYWHSGIHWDASKRNTPADNRRELFWSQTVFAQLLGGGRAPCHFVYPNGDYNYEPFLAEYGLIGASRVGAAVSAIDGDLHQLTRAYLDEGPWAKSGGQTMQGFPESRPRDGAFLIDFTHGIDAKPDSANQRRWAERLATIAKRHGREGDDSLWCAPSGAIVAYTTVARRARIAVSPAGAIITLPSGLPGSPLTIRIEGLDAKAEVMLPGAVVRRHGSTAWITTGMLGEPGVPAPKPAVRRVWEGPATTATFAKPVLLAGVRLRQAGDPGAGYAFGITCTLADGSTKSLPTRDDGKLASTWGAWRLYPTIPDGEAIAVTAVAVPPNKALNGMEIWAVDEAAPGD